ncbi:MAG: hypothetical protein AAFX06_12500 [Planctomycetota bacterium]
MEPTPAEPKNPVTTTAVPEPSVSGTPDQGGLPSVAVQALVSVLVVAHLVILLVSYTSIIEPSSTQASLIEKAAPYLRMTHFSADGRPFYLAHGNSDEQPHRLQVATLPKGVAATDSSIEWTTIEPAGTAGLAESDRYARWMALADTLAASEQSSLAAAILGPMVKTDASIDLIRVLRLPTMLTTVEDDANAVAYLARVVRDGDATRLVSVQSRRLTTSVRGEDGP